MSEKSRFVTIQEWMTEYEELKGNRLMVYAVIYGFSQDGKSWFYGSIGYLQKWTGASRNTIIRTLEFLKETGFLIKKTTTVNNQETPIYQARVPKMGPVPKWDTPRAKMGHPPCQNGTTPRAKMAHNNIDNIYIDKNIDNISLSKNKFLQECEGLKTYWNSTIASQHIPKVQKLSETRKSHLKNLIKDYGYEGVTTTFSKIPASDFLSGRKNGWSATFDWIIKPSNFIKVYEGNYDRNTRETSSSYDEMIQGLQAFMEEE